MSFDANKIFVNNIKIENFLSFKNLEVKDFKKINLIFGENGTGKTNLLRAIDISQSGHDASLKKQINKLFFSLFNLKKGEIRIPNKLNLSYNEDEDNFMRKYFNRVFTENFRIKITYLPKYRDLLGLLSDPIQHIEYSQSSIIDKFHSKDYNYSLDIAFENTILLEGENCWQDYTFDIGDITGSSLVNKRLILDYVKEFYPKAVDIATIPSYGINIFFEEEPPISLGSGGYGFKRFFMIALALISNKNGLVLIDEIENGIHFNRYQYICQEILKLAKEYNNQLFITSHSQELTKRMVEEIENQDLCNEVAFYYIYHSKIKNEIDLERYEFKEGKEMINNDFIFTRIV